jgi:D-alanyl-lipoteichoic acid acyltransferase DltB (MBOAT superfamily)
MGLWHGASWTFLIYGLFLGAGVSVNKLFDVLMRKYFSVSYNTMLEHSLSGLLGAAFTFMYFSMGLSCFWLDFNDLVALMVKLNIQGFGVILVLGGLICAVVMFLIRIFRDVFDRAVGKSSALLGNFYFVRARLSFELLIVIAFWFYGFGDIPDFVYKGF